MNLTSSCKFVKFGMFFVNQTSFQIAYHAVHNLSKLRMWTNVLNKRHTAQTEHCTNGTLHKRPRIQAPSDALIVNCKIRTGNKWLFNVKDELNSHYHPHPYPIPIRCVSHFQESRGWFTITYRCIPALYLLKALRLFYLFTQVHPSNLLSCVHPSALST